MLITNGWSNPLLETPLKNSGTTILLCIDKLSSIPQQVVDSTTKIRKKTEIETNDTLAIK